MLRIWKSKVGPVQKVYYNVSKDFVDSLIKDLETVQNVEDFIDDDEPTVVGKTN